jgi:hypothetical protein
MEQSGKISLTLSACLLLIYCQLLVYFATFTIFIMLVSLGFQIWQTILTKQQLQQGTGT